MKPVRYILAAAVFAVALGISINKPYKSPPLMLEPLAHVDIPKVDPAVWSTPWQAKTFEQSGAEARADAKKREALSNVIFVPVGTYAVSVPYKSDYVPCGGMFPKC